MKNRNVFQTIAVVDCVRISLGGGKYKNTIWCRTEKKKTTVRAEYAYGGREQMSFVYGFFFLLFCFYLFFFSFFVLSRHRYTTGHGVRHKYDSPYTYILITEDGTARRPYCFATYKWVSRLRQTVCHLPPRRPAASVPP